ncbi:FCD domain-containing protein [Pseudorhodobacter antarcticus]|nr:FCD domain-containing protein [Pseudorhodobacter antarcticus]
MTRGTLETNGRLPSVRDLAARMQAGRDLRSKALTFETLQIGDTEHGQIIDRIEAGDAAGASAAMQMHSTPAACNLNRILDLPMLEEVPT